MHRSGHGVTIPFRVYTVAKVESKKRQISKAINAGVLHANERKKEKNTHKDSKSGRPSAVSNSGTRTSGRSSRLAGARWDLCSQYSGSGVAAIDVSETRFTKPKKKKEKHVHAYASS